MISFSPPDITQEEIDEVVDTLKSGWITTGPKVRRLEAELAKVLDSADSLTLDCSKLDYLSSAGLRVLFRVHQQMSSRNGMKLTNINETVREVLEVSGFADILTVE